MSYKKVINWHTQFRMRSFGKFSPENPRSETKMEVLNKLAKAANNNTVLNVCLVGSFIVLTVRSVNQQKDIEALEAQKDSLIKSNKAMKKSIWEWKQKLFAEAESDSPLVPLARLKAIYGEAPIAQTGTLFSLSSVFFFFFNCLIKAY